MPLAERLPAPATIVEALSPERLKLLGLVAIFGAVSVAAYVLLRTHSERVSIRSGLSDVLANPMISDSRSLIMEIPFLQRIMGPGAGRIAALIYRFGPRTMSERTSKRLVLAGLADRLDADGFFALSAALPLMLGALLLAYSQIASVNPLLWALVPAAVIFPKLWLTSKVEARQREIKLALPDTLDLLTIALEAGLGFDAALARVVGANRSPLSDELYRLLQEVRIGISRQEALKGLANRTEVPDLDQFITAVNQADVFGISIGRVLRIQAHELRQKRSQYAEERAAKTPVKLLFPLILCIFPALFTVLVGPAAITIMDNLFSTL